MPSSPLPEPQPDTSPQATALARLVDRLCRRPGQYLILLDVPDPPGRPWRIEIRQTDALRRGEIGKRKDR